MKIITHVSFLLISTVALTSCLQQPLLPGQVKKEWAKNIYQLGIVPTFPPREDIYVGDVYTTTEDLDEWHRFIVEDIEDLSNKEKKVKLENLNKEFSKIGMSTRLARLNLNQSIHDEYRNTISAPQTTPDYDQVLDNPSVAAVQQKIDELDAKIKTEKAKKESLEEKKRKANSAFTEATYVNTDAEAALNKANKALEEAKNKPAIPADTSAEKAQVDILTQQIITHDQNLLKIKRDIDKVNLEIAYENGRGNEKDEAKLKSLQQKKLDLEKGRDDIEYQKELAEHKLKIVKTKITSMTATPVDVSEEERAVKEATEAKEKALLDKTRLEREKTKITQDVDKAATEITAKITSLSGERPELVTQRDALIKAGARNMLPTPMHKTHSLFLTDSELKKNNHSYNSRVNRLKLVAFPEFTSTSISASDLSAFIPGEALHANFSASSVDKVSIKIPSAESYGLSLKRVFDKLFDIGGNAISLRDDNDDLTNLLHYAQLQHGLLGKTDGKVVTFRVITEVFYARAFDVNLFSSDSFGSVLDVAKLPSDADDNITEQLEAFQGPISSSQNEVFSSSLDKLKRTQSVPGGTVQVLNYSDSSISIRRVFDRPVAVGTRGITFKFKGCPEDDSSPTCSRTIFDVKVDDTAVMKERSVES
jgi:hypothetical protein